MDRNVDCNRNSDSVSDNLWRLATRQIPQNNLQKM
jgi:hypothetical protein